VIVRRRIFLAIVVIATVVSTAHAQTDPRLDVKLRRIVGSGLPLASASFRSNVFR